MPPAVADPDFLKLVKSSISDIQGWSCLAIQGYAYHWELGEPNLLPQRDKQYDEDWTQPLLRLPFEISRLYEVDLPPLGAGDT